MPGWRGCQQALLPIIGMMDQALRRFTTLLEALVGAGPAGLSLGVLAERSALPPATCTRALKSMTRLGWADQAGNRGSYRLGPRATALSATASYRGELLQHAEPHLRAFVRRHPSVGIALVALRDGQRFGLWSHGPDGDGGLELAANRDVWGMPSGRLLIALLPLRQRRRWCGQVGLPTAQQWPGIATSRELDAALAVIRRERIAQVVRDGSVYTTVPVPDGLGGTVGLGCWHRGRQIDPVIMRAMRRIAAALG